MESMSQILLYMRPHMQWIPSPSHKRTGSFVLWSSTPVATTWLKIYNELLFPSGIKVPLYSLTHSHCCNRWLWHTRGIGICLQHWGKSFQPSQLHKNKVFSLMLQFAEGEKRYCHLRYRLSKYLDHIRGVDNKPTSSLLTIRLPCRQEFSRLFWQQKLFGFRPSYLHLWLQSSMLGWDMLRFFGLLFSWCCSVNFWRHCRSWNFHVGHLQLYLMSWQQSSGVSWSGHHSKVMTFLKKTTAEHLLKNQSFKLHPAQCRYIVILLYFRMNCKGFCSSANVVIIQRPEILTPSFTYLCMCLYLYAYVCMLVYIYIFWYFHWSPHLNCEYTMMAGLNPRGLFQP